MNKTKIEWCNCACGCGSRIKAYDDRGRKMQFARGHRKGKFVQSMGDLFHNAVPDERIKAVFEACEAAPQHRYLFLTKNPGRYMALYESKGFPYANNFWFGTTCTKPDDEFTFMRNTPYKCFVSIEPILEPFGAMVGDEWPDWVIIGAETGNRKGKVMPKREWIKSLVEQCRAAGVPVFMKNSLAPIWGEQLIREFPWDEGRMG